MERTELPIAVFDSGLGGIAKGYTAGRVRKILQDAGVRAAIVSLGGSPVSRGGGTRRRGH